MEAEILFELEQIYFLMKVICTILIFGTVMWTLTQFRKK